MKLKHTFSVNLILGLLTGFVFSLLILSQGRMISSFLSINNPDTNYMWITILSIVIAILAFIFITRVFLCIRTKRLTMYFILSVVISLIFSLIVSYLLLLLCGQLYISEKSIEFLNSSVGSFIALTLGYLSFLLLIAIFVSVFMLLVNRKVKYIQYISEEVKKIEINGFGGRIEIRGNDELSDLTSGINTMSTKLKEKIDLEKQIQNNKNELITNVSHDLRTPLTSIIGYVSLLKQTGFNDKEKFNEYISVVDRRLKGLNSLINELFEYTKLNSSEFKLECSKVDIMPMIKHLINEYALIYKEEGLKLQSHIDLDHCDLMIDSDKMLRVIQNLLDNARKYALKESTVGINVYENEKYLYINIKNQANHLNTSDVNKFFERFYKGDTSRSQGDSSGLGLSIVKRIVELHKGTIDVKLNGNTVSFEVKLPMALDI